MEDVIRRLLGKAFLFDDPSAYAAGVTDAVKALEELRRAGEVRDPSEKAAAGVGAEEPRRLTV